MLKSGCSKITSFLVSASFVLLFTQGCIPMDTSPNPSRYPSSGYDPQYQRGYGDDYYQQRERERLYEERRRIEREREHLDRERDRLEWERKRSQRGAPISAPQPPVSRAPREECPSGFHETDRKCGDKERRQGCKDIKLPGGKRCINR